MDGSGKFTLPDTNFLNFNINQTKHFSLQFKRHIIIRMLRIDCYIITQMFVINAVQYILGNEMMYTYQQYACNNGAVT
jgi:hypothetical protein